MYQPQERTQRIIDAINEMVRSGYNAESVVALQPEIDSLRRASLFYQALQTEGMIAALQGKFDEAEHKFKLATTASGGLPALKINHALAMVNLMAFERACQIVDEVIDYIPDNAGALRDAFTVYIDANNLCGAQIVLSHMTLLDVANDDERKLVANLEAKISKVAEYGADWKQWAFRAFEISQALVSEGYGHTKLIEQDLGDDIAMIFSLYSSNDTEILNAERFVHHFVAKKPFLPIDSAVSYTCGSVYDYDASISE